MLESKASFRPSKSLALIVLKPTGYGAKLAGWNFSWPVAFIVARVRPWKERSSVTIVFFESPPVSWPYLRASFIAASFASAPLLPKKTPL